MSNKTIKSTIIAGILAFGTAFSVTTPAQAGSNFSVYIGGGHGSGIHYSGKVRRHHGHYTQHRRAACFPRRALKKAYRYGLDHPRIQRINNRRIVVRGFNRGYPAKIVFKRNGHGCQIIKTRGI